MEALLDLLTGLMDKYPQAAAVLAVIGFMRVINKPLFSFLRAVAEATTTTKDNEILDGVEKSKAYATVSYLLDWFGSVKIQAKK